MRAEVPLRRKLWKTGRVSLTGRPRNMDCLEFRRAALADPQQLPAAAASHAQHCPACRAFLEQSRESEAHIADALRVAVPRRLEERLLASLGLRRTKRFLALAAGVLIVAAAGVLVAVLRPDPVARAGIDFVVFEEAQSIVEAKPADFGVAAAAARKMGLSLSTQLGDIRYVCFYPFAGGAAHHLLVKTPLGKVTLLLIPSGQRESRASVSARGLEAVVLPAAAGSVAIIADSSRSIQRAEVLLKQ